MPPTSETPAAVLAHRISAFVLFLSAFCGNHSIVAQEAGRKPLPEYDRTVEAPLFQLRPARIRSLSAPGNGKITHLTVNLGDHVRRGDIIARVQVDRLDASVRRAIGDIYALRQQQTAARTADETEKLDSLSRQLDASKVRLREVAEQLRNLAIVSPCSGIVDRLQVLPGEQTRQGQPLLRIVETTRLQLRVPIDATNLKPGQEVPVLLGRGRTVGTIADVVANDGSADLYAPLLRQAAIAIVVLGNDNQALNDGEFAYLPIAPLALLPETFARTLDKLSPQVKTISEAGELSTIPISVIGPAGNGKLLVAGGFAEDERIVRPAPPEEGSPTEQWEPVPETLIFTKQESIYSPRQFASALPALAETLPEIAAVSHEQGESTFKFSGPFERPDILQHLLMPDEYPLCLTSEKKAAELLGISAADMAYFREVHSYFQQEAIRRRLAIKQIDDLKGATPSGTLPDYVEAVGQLNDDYVAAASIVSDYRNEEARLAAWISGFGNQVLFTKTGQSLLELEDSQIRQMRQMRQILDEQRQDMLASYLNGRTDRDKLMEDSRQMLQAWSSDLELAISPNQAETLKLLRIEAPADPSPAKATPATASSVEQSEDDDEPAPRVALPAALQQPAESPLVPYLIFGGGALLLIVVAITGFVLFRRRGRNS
ncbi:HlyD family efflux transporter periplasmic adaptor subunit [Rubinisphaera margarita]|uniref:HlyD family efflux transporter periplasmic adaptor subunit n=1 Tax=Rubinisphaera margarita TaxID=2909586 RepID=UPI001EE89F80|nr:HlyD family efflux transporter periplasmic adaptor subunit [Rubinisphaera margarita]MCG6156220.1 efflux RND transporter periplasmic adaptor subunit [Rubinisphaera margarita]